MRRVVFALLCACGTPARETTFDGSAALPTVVNVNPGPTDDLDASVPVGARCTPGETRVVAQGSILQGPFVDDTSAFFVDSEYGGAGDAGTSWGSYSGTKIRSVPKSGGATTLLYDIEQPPISWDLSTVLGVGSRVGWLDSKGAFGAVFRGAKDGSSSAVILAGISAPTVLAASGDTLYFVSGVALMRAAADGTGEAILSVDAPASEIAIGATHLYLIIHGEPMRIPVNGGDIEPLLISPDPVSTRYAGISVGDDGYVRVVAITELDKSPMSARLVRIPTDGGTPQTFSPTFDAQNTGIPRIYFTVVDGAYTYVSTISGVFRAESTLSFLGIGPGPIAGPLAVDTTSVYWATRTSPTTQSTLLAWCKLP
jgi:hypothetical protein